MIEDIALWGNAAAVPIIVAITQFLKRSFPMKFKRRADVMSLLVSLMVCFGWWLYNTPEAVIIDQMDDGIIAITKGFIDLCIISFATWLSASKSYDLFLGDKKRAKQLDEHLVEKEKLRVELEAMKHANDEEPVDEPVDEDQDLAEKLREILEGRD